MSTEPEAAPQTVAGRLSTYLRGGGVITPLITVLFAFFVAALVVLFTGGNPITTFQAIFEGTGLNWLFPWTSEEDRIVAEINLQQTLIVTTPLILTGLAVAFAFRCGLFNIGGQGQYLVGTYAAVWVGSSFQDMAAVPHIVLSMLAACAAGAVWGGLAGLLKATTGANEVISTIMLNYVAIWTGAFAFGLGGPLQSDTNTSVPVSNDIAENAKLPVFWGDPELQGLHVGIFVALAFLLVFWVVLNRTRTGFEVRAVGLQPRGGARGGDLGRPQLRARDGDLRPVRRPRRVARRARLAVPRGDERHRDLADRLPRHRGGAARPQHGGRGHVLRPAVRRAGHRDVGAQPRPDRVRAREGDQPDADHPGPRRAARERRRARDLPVEAAQPATAAAARRQRRRHRHERGRLRPPPAEDARGDRPADGAARRLGRRGAGVPRLLRRAAAADRSARRADRDPRARGRRCGRVGAARRRAPAGHRRARRGRRRADRRDRGDALGRRQPRARGRLVGAVRGDAALRDAAAVRGARRAVLRAQRGHQHRPRGHDADGRLLGDLGRRGDRLVGGRAADRHGLGRRCWRSSTRSSRSACAPTRSSRGSR